MLGSMKRGMKNRLESDGLVTVCKIITYETDIPEGYDFQNAPPVNKIIIKVCVFFLSIVCCLSENESLSQFYTC